MNNNNNNSENQTSRYEAPKATVLQFNVDANLMSGETTDSYKGLSPAVYSSDESENDWN